MTINLINPNYNLIHTSTTAGTQQSANPASVGAAGAADGALSFSDILETVISNMNPGVAVPEGNVSGRAGAAVNLDEIFQKASDTYHVPVELLKAVAKAESNFDPTAESHAGAQGIMQLMPGTARALGVTDSFDAEQNIMGGAKYLSQQLERYDGNAVLALAAYNAGPGNVAKYNGVPPFKETQNYIAKVMGYAGESINAGEVPLVASAQESDTGILKDLASGLGLNLNLADMDVKDYTLLMDLYRYQMQLNILTDSDPDSDTGDLFESFAALV